MKVKTDTGVRKALAELATEFKGDSTPYARGYRAALREAANALCGEPIKE